MTTRINAIDYLQDTLIERADACIPIMQAPDK